MDPVGDPGGLPPSAGAPAFHPAMMTALLLYAYTAGVYSSRKLARRATAGSTSRAVTALAKPDLPTIALFRNGT